MWVLRLWLLLLVVCGSGAIAQSDETQAADVQAVVEPDAEPEPAALASLFPAYEGWESIATRAEETLAVDDPSAFALNRLRDELYDWREIFAARLSENQGRLSTIDAQIEALGSAPEGTEEPPAVAERRQELRVQRDALATPDALVAEAHARANGLLSEIDSQIRNRDASRLLRRDPSPLNPALWPAAFAALTESIKVMAADMTAGVGISIENGRFSKVAPFAILSIAVGLFLLIRSRKWVRDITTRLPDQSGRSRAIWSFVLSLGQIVLPLIGLFLVIVGLQSIDVLTRRADDMFDALFAAVSVIILARWLNEKLFPPGRAFGPLSYGPEANDRIRRLGVTLSWGLAAIVILQAAMRLVEATAVSVSVVLMPLMIFLAVVLYRLGAALRQPPIDDPAYSGTGGRVRAVVGRAVMLVAVVSPILALLGYTQAAGGLFRPAVITLAILGAVVVFQRLASDIYDPHDVKDDESAGPLMPVLIGLAIGVLALPFLALAWGARVTDIWELWARISAGFAVGETRISPTDFLRFLLVFAFGYVLTRFVQATLRNSVLPRTRLDLGGQNAVISGVGYVGILLAGIVAITSAGIDLTSLAFVAGALSLGIGFGLQNIVQNFVSGIILLIERPIGEGDMIEVNGQMGFVRDISVRSTRIETFDRTDVIIPNADLVSGTVTNWTRGNPVGRLILPIGVAYGSDVEQVRAILQEVAEKHPMSLMDPPPQVFFMGFGASSLDFEVRVQLRDVNWKIVTLSEMNFEINAKFAEAGIEIPFPQQDVWLRNPAKISQQDPEEP